MFKVKKIFGLSKSSKGKVTFDELQLSPRHPINIHLNDKTFTALISDYNNSEIVVYPKQDTSYSVLELQIGDDIPILIPQSFGAFQGQTRVKNITGSENNLITLELCGTLREKEDRKFYRLPVSFDIGYSSQGPNSREFIHSRTVDISAGGLRFYVAHSFPVGCRLSVSFNINTGNAEVHFLLPTKVMHAQPLAGRNTVGVKFIDIPASKQEFISNFITTRSEGQILTEEHKEEYTKIEYEEAVRVFLHWCQQKQLRPSWVILHDIHEFRDWLEFNGRSKHEIDRWLDHIIQYL